MSTTAIGAIDIIAARPDGEPRDNFSVQHRRMLKINGTHRVSSASASGISASELSVSHSSIR